MRYPVKPLMVHPARLSADAIDGLAAAAIAGFKAGDSRLSLALSDWVEAERFRRRDTKHREDGEGEVPPFEDAYDHVCDEQFNHGEPACNVEAEENRARIMGEAGPPEPELLQVDFRRYGDAELAHAIFGLTCGTVALLKRAAESNLQPLGFDLLLRMSAAAGIELVRRQGGAART